MGVGRRLPPRRAPLRRPRHLPRRQHVQHRHGEHGHARLRVGHDLPAPRMRPHASVHQVVEVRFVFTCYTW